ncbi:MAG: hypothetical protein HDS08_05900 [Bacteroides sp.]|nr:hypothetical protein [Bacteroides sp.]
MSASKKTIAAVEIGSSKIKAALGTVDEFGTLTVDAVEQVAMTDSVRYGWIRNVNDVSGVINNILRNLENRIGRKITSVYVGVGGRSLSATDRHVERQLAQDMEIVPQLLENMRSEAYRMPGFVDREVIDVLPCEYQVDRISTFQPSGMVGRNVRATYKVISAKQQQRRNIDTVLTSKLGLTVNGYIVRQKAQAELVLTREEMALGCMLVDFGAETITVSIYKNGVLRYLQTIPLGSRLITRDLMNLNYVEEQAEDIKRQNGNAMAQPVAPAAAGVINFNEISNYVGARVKELTANIKAQVKFAGMNTSDLPAGIIIVGNGARLNGFNSRLESETGMSVRSGAPTPSVRISDSRISPSEVIDVIAVLRSAAMNNPVECTVAPEPYVPQGVELQTVSQPEEPQDEPAYVPEDIPEPTRKKKKSFGFISRLRNGITDIMRDPEDDDDDEELNDDN